MPGNASKSSPTDSGALGHRAVGAGIDAAGLNPLGPAVMSATSASPDVTLHGEELFMSHVHLHGGPAPVRRFLPDPDGPHLEPNDQPRQRMFDLELPCDDAADGYRGIDTRQATKVLLRP